jgi:hypothetical protein
MKSSHSKIRGSLILSSIADFGLQISGVVEPPEKRELRGTEFESESPATVAITEGHASITLGQRRQSEVAAFPSNTLRLRAS